MKKILSTAAFLIAVTAFITSCKKEYVCHCNNGAYSQIVEANSVASAESECDKKGDDCNVQ